MILAASLLALAWLLWRGAGALAVLLVAAGVAVQIALAVRFVQATTGGVGGHAEWVRETSHRPRLARSPVWTIGAALVAAGVALALVR